MAKSYRQGTSGLFLPGSGKSNIVNFGTLEVWAEDGSVWYADRHTGKSGSMAPSQAKYRFGKVFEMMGKASDPGVERDSQERRDIRNVAEGIEAVIRKALEQSPEEVHRTASPLEMNWVNGNLKIG